MRSQDHIQFARVHFNQHWILVETITTRHKLSSPPAFANGNEEINIEISFEISSQSSNLLKIFHSVTVMCWVIETISTFKTLSKIIPQISNQEIETANIEGKKESLEIKEEAASSLPNSFIECEVDNELIRKEDKSQNGDNNTKQKNESINLSNETQQSCSRLTKNSSKQLNNSSQQFQFPIINSKNSKEISHIVDLSQINSSSSINSVAPHQYPDYYGLLQKSLQTLESQQVFNSLSQFSNPLLNDSLNSSKMDLRKNYDSFPLNISLSQSQMVTNQNKFHRHKASFSSSQVEDEEKEEVKKQLKNCNLFEENSKQSQSIFLSPESRPCILRNQFFSSDKSSSYFSPDILPNRNLYLPLTLSSFNLQPDNQLLNLSLQTSVKHQKLVDQYDQLTKREIQNEEESLSEINEDSFSNQRSFKKAIHQVNNNSNQKQMREIPVSLSLEDLNNKRDRKNLVKNFIKAFKGFLNNPIDESEIKSLLEESGTSLCQQRKDFELFVSHHNYNNSMMVALLQNKKFSSLLGHFFISKAKDWIINSKIKDKNSHLEALSHYIQSLEDSQALSRVRCLKQKSSSLSHLHNAVNFS